MEYCPIKGCGRYTAGHPICRKFGLMSLQLAEGRSSDCIRRFGHRSAKTGILSHLVIKHGKRIKSVRLSMRHCLFVFFLSTSSDWFTHVKISINCSGIASGSVSIKMVSHMCA